MSCYILIIIINNNIISIILHLFDGLKYIDLNIYLLFILGEQVNNIKSNSKSDPNEPSI